MALFQYPLQSMAKQELSFDRAEEEIGDSAGINLMIFAKVSDDKHSVLAVGARVQHCFTRHEQCR